MDHGGSLVEDLFANVHPAWSGARNSRICGHGPVSHLVLRNGKARQDGFSGWPGLLPTAFIAPKAPRAPKEDRDEIHLVCIGFFFSYYHRQSVVGLDFTPLEINIPHNGADQPAAPHQFLKQ
jgi:hypothetical protein